MKLSDDYILKNIAGTPVVVPVGEAVKNIKGMITLNDSGEFIWKELEKGKEPDEILEDLKKEYDAPDDILQADLDNFIEKLRKYSIVSDE